MNRLRPLHHVLNRVELPFAASFYFGKQWGGKEGWVLIALVKIWGLALSL